MIFRVSRKYKRLLYITSIYSVFQMVGFVHRHYCFRLPLYIAKVMVIGIFPENYPWPGNIGFHGHWSDLTCQDTCHKILMSVSTYISWLSWGECPCVLHNMGSNLNDSSVCIDQSVVSHSLSPLTKEDC